MSEELGQVNSVENLNKRWLDLAWTNYCNNVRVESSKFNMLLNEVHHYALEMTSEIEIDNSDINTEALPERNFSKANYPTLCSLLNDVDWDSLFNVANIEDSVSVFYDKLFDLIDLCLPNEIHKATNHPKYFNKTLISLKNRTNNGKTKLANMFALCDVYENPSNGSINESDFDYLDGCQKIRDMPIAIDRHTLLSELKSWKASLSTMPDGVPSIVLKEYREALTTPLILLFNKPKKQSLNVENYLTYDRDSNPVQDQTSKIIVGLLNYKLYQSCLRRLFQYR